MNKSEVYRKAAEIIVRDGKYGEGDLVDDRDRVEGRFIAQEQALRDRSRPVCALGACARAEFELYGTMPDLYGAEDVYTVYGFQVPVPSSVNPGKIYYRAIHYINDEDGTTAEDVALFLKRRAEEVEGE